MRSGYPIVSFPPRSTPGESRSTLGKSGPPSTAFSPKEESASAAARSTRQIILGRDTAALARMETGFNPDSTGDSCSVASGWIQEVLEMALAASC